MNCTESLEQIERYPALGDDARAEIHRHVADCASCRAHFDEFSGLNQALSELASARSSVKPQAVAAALRQRGRQRVREVTLSAVASVLCGLAIFWFIDVDLKFAQFALPAMALVFAFQAWRSHREGTRFLTAANGDAGPTQWVEELRRERRRIRLFGPLVTLQFSALTGFAISLHGLGDFRVAAYIVTVLGIAAYVVWQIARRLPQLQRELALLEALRAQ
jgi:anti-sigma factor RsiW